MNKKHIINLIFGIILLFLASAMIILPKYKLATLSNILIVVFSIYFVLKLVQFIFTREEKDYEYLSTSIISLVSIIAVILLKEHIKMIVLIILTWMALICFTKLKKADYYHDHHNKMWIYQIAALLIFLTSGLLMGLNLFYGEIFQIKFVGNFLFINSIFEILEPIILYIKGDK